jgi:hypothetical protein
MKDIDNSSLSVDRTKISIGGVNLDKNFKGSAIVKA